MWLFMGIELTPFEEKKMKTVWLPEWQCEILEDMPNFSLYLEMLLNEQDEFKKKKPRSK